LLSTVFAVPWFRSSFRLGGGTALAEYYLGHRISDDIDLFTIDPADLRPAAKLVREMADSEKSVRVAVLRSHPLQWTFSVSTPRGDETRVDITTVDTPFRDAAIELEGVTVASLYDIVIGKMLAASDRTEGKDVIDLWAIEKLANMHLNELADELGARDPRFVVSPDRWARTLHRLAVSLPDLDLPRAIVEVSGAELKRFFEQASLDALKRLLPDA
jgi:predicted nucleotidyltransferase component of viral defense system